MAESERAGGLGASLQGLLATLIAIFQTRLALLVTEVEEEKRRLLATVAWGAVAVLIGCFGLAFAAVFVTVLFWDSHRLAVLGGMTVLFFALAAWAMWRVRQLVQASGDMLAATLAELDADRQALMRAASPQEDSPEPVASVKSPAEAAREAGS